MAQRITKAQGMRSQKRMRMSLTSNSRRAGVNEVTTARNPAAVGSLRNFLVTYFFFLFPRRRARVKGNHSSTAIEDCPPAVIAGAVLLPCIPQGFVRRPYACHFSDGPGSRRMKLRSNGLR